MAHRTVHGPLGAITLFEEDGTLVALEWGRAPAGADTPLLIEAARQMDAYFAGRLTAFDLPLAPKGTAFQKNVWALMRRIPFGQTRSYGAIAADLKSAPRAVGGACGRNPIAIIVPCHRIVAAGGALGGFSGGDGQETKRWLLRHEGLT
jgi:methylated-DNA-[protein]-cysteine S-methyltransferase